jgi:hypothetical protein
MADTSDLKVSLLACFCAPMRSLKSPPIQYSWGFTGVEPLGMGVAGRTPKVEQKVEQPIRVSHKGIFLLSAPFYPVDRKFTPLVADLRGLAPMRLRIPPFARQLRIFKRSHCHRIAASLCVAIADAKSITKHETIAVYR